MLIHENNKFLFTGDIDLSAEATVIARGTPIAAEILKVGHHGSKYSSGEEFLAAVSPLEAVIQVGSGNPYDHPAEETIDYLQEVGARIWRNDLLGTIVFKSDGAGYTVFPVGRNAIFIPVVIQDIIENLIPTSQLNSTSVPPSSTR